MTTTPQKPSYKQGDVVLVLFPNTDLRTAKRRPAVIVQADQLQTGLPQIIVAMITSNMARAPHASRIVVYQRSVEGKQAGILTDSVVMTDNLATVGEAAIERRIGALAIPSLLNALRHTFAI